MDLRDDPQQAAFRAEVRKWLETSLPQGWGTEAFEKPETAEDEVAFLRQWQRTLHDELRHDCLQEREAGPVAGLSPGPLGRCHCASQRGLCWEKTPCNGQKGRYRRVN